MWLKNLQIVLPDGMQEGTLQIEHGLITAIESGSPPPDQPSVSADGLIALPSMIDLCGDMLEREIEPRPSSLFPIDAAIDEFDKRLVGAGITTSTAIISLDGPGSHWRSRRPELAIAVANTLAMHADSALAELRVHLRVDPTDPSAVAAAEALLAEQHTSLLGLRSLGADPQSRAAVERLITLAQRANTTIGLHDPLESDLASAAALGVQICFFPQTLAAAVAARSHSMLVAVGAPNYVRGGSHTKRLAAKDALQAGVVDLLVADEAPIAMLHATVGLVAAGVCSWPTVVDLIAATPARVLGRPAAAIAIGSAANLCLIEQGPRPRVRMCIRAGQIVYRRS
ncbi:MAG: alpha-D-ribose 1-methylphosphonate 5-triphosphate diphosphatase [Roseiflexaceae bacterium]